MLLACDSWASDDPNYPPGQLESQQARCLLPWKHSARAAANLKLESSRVLSSARWKREISPVRARC